VRFGSLKHHLLALGVILTLRARELSAQVQVISLAATSVGALSVTITSGAVQTIANVTDNAVNNFPIPVGITTSWAVRPGQTNTVRLIAYFSVPSQALVGPTQIPSSRILGRVTTGIPTTYTAMTQNGIGGVGSAGGSLQLFSVSITGANKNASRSDNLDLQLNLVGAPALAAGSYAGVLNIRAVTQ
jgi:hypothetical protein